MSPATLLLLGLGVWLLSPRSDSARARRRMTRLRAARSPSPLISTSTTARERRASRLPAWALPLAGAGGTAVISVTLAGPGGLVVAGLVGPIVATWLRRGAAARTVLVDAAARPTVPLLLDLIAAALRAGAPTSIAVSVVANTAPVSLRGSLSRAAALLQLGADPKEAWAPLRDDAILGPVAAVATRSARSGIRLADGLERQADELRAELRADAVARAHRVATLALLPLGLCFLPAFVCIGVAPIVIGVAGDAFAAVAP